MGKIIGNTTATPNPSPDWNQMDETKADYIKNKPELDDVIRYTSQTLTTEQQAQARTNIGADKVYEADLVWGGKDLKDTMSPIDAVLVDNMKANRLAFMNPDDIKIEYSRDGGATWQDYGATDVEKIKLVTTHQPFYIGKYQNGDIVETGWQVRVTITAKANKLYFTTNKVIVSVTDDQAIGCYVNIEYKLKNETQFKTYKTKVPLDGAPGYNVIQLDAKNLEDLIGHQDSSMWPIFGYTHIEQFRYTFGFENTNNIGTNSLCVTELKMYGPVSQYTHSNLAYNGHLYAYDMHQNATFPAAITATEFKDSNGNKMATEKIAFDELSKTATINGGSILRIDDISYLKHQIEMNIHSMNLLDLSSLNNTEASDSTNVILKCQDGKLIGQGIKSLKIVSTPEAIINIERKPVTFTLFGDSENVRCIVRVKDVNNNILQTYELSHIGSYTTIDLSKFPTGSKLSFIGRVSKNTTPSGTCHPMLVYGNAIPVAFHPFVNDLSIKSVQKYNKNLSAISTLSNTTENPKGKIVFDQIKAHETYTLSCWLKQATADAASDTKISLKVVYTDGSEDITDISTVSNNAFTYYSLSIETNIDKEIAEISCNLFDYTSDDGNTRNASAINIQLEVGDLATGYEEYVAPLEYNFDSNGNPNEDIAIKNSTATFIVPDNDIVVDISYMTENYVSTIYNQIEYAVESYMGDTLQDISDDFKDQANDIVKESIAKLDLGAADIVNSWWCNPRCIYNELRDAVYVSGISRTGKLTLRVFDLRNNHVETVDLGYCEYYNTSGTKLIQTDDHNTPGFLIEDDKPPIVAYTHHATDPKIWIRVGTYPYDFKSLERATEIEVSFVKNGETTDDKCTYSSFIRKPGTNTILLITRFGNILRVAKSDDWGVTWSEAKDLTNKMYYGTFRINNDNKMLNYVICEHPITSTNSVVRMVNIDLNSGDIYGANGNIIGTLWDWDNFQTIITATDSATGVTNNTKTVYSGTINSVKNHVRTFDVGIGKSVAVAKIPTYKLTNVIITDTDTYIKLDNGEIITLTDDEKKAFSKDDSESVVFVADQLTHISKINDATFCLSGRGGTYGVLYYNGNDANPSWSFEEIVSTGVPIGYYQSCYVGGACFTGRDNKDDEVILCREENGTWYAEKWNRNSDGIWNKTKELYKSTDKLGRPQAPWGAEGKGIYTFTRYPRYVEDSYIDYYGDQIVVRE